MKDIFTPLTDQEIEQLEDILLNRIDDDADTAGKDEGILDISSLDGYFTAVVSGPETIVPSLWIEKIWGNYEPEWKTEKDFEIIFSLLARYMNSITNHLMTEPESFEPQFMERKVDGKTWTIVDEWCHGYMTGVELIAGKWDLDSLDMKILIAPIQIFGTEAGWAELHDMNEQERENIQQAITPNVRIIHGYWLERREEFLDNESSAAPIRRSEPRVGRNDPCPCGSGKKYKKCCLH